jgi:predicted  nucleic acid-binding Zn-ribbon protein
MEAPRSGGYLHGMDTETRAAITALGETMSAGFARMDRYFELNQAQFLELRGEVAELRTEVRELRERMDALTERVARLEHEVAQLRDYVTREIAAIRLELRELRGRSDQTDELRREIAELTVRVDAHERRRSD